MANYKKQDISFNPNCPEPLKRFKVVAASWAKECERYTKALEDAPWWYNERANVGLLATAASRINWIALEEYGTEKVGRRVKRGADKSTKNGRCDLYMYDCPSSKNKDASDLAFAIEAKQAWPAMTVRASSSDRVSKRWSAALEAARELDRGEADHRIAALFVVPYSKEAFDAEARSSMVDRCLALKGVHAVAWYWVPEGEKVPQNLDTKNYFPGVLLAIGKVSKGH